MRGTPVLKARSLGSRSRRTESGAPHGAPPHNSVAICAGRRADDRRVQFPARIALPAAHPSRRCPDALTRGARSWRAAQRVLCDPCWPVRPRPARAVPATSLSALHHQQQCCAVHRLAHLTPISLRGLERRSLHAMSWFTRHDDLAKLIGPPMLRPLSAAATPCAILRTATEMSSPVQPAESRPPDSARQTHRAREHACR